MTASIKDVNKLCDHEDYVEDQEIKLENKEEQLNQLKETLEAKENEIRARKDRLKRTKTVSYLTGTRWTKSNDCERAQELGARAIAETASKLADKTRLNAKERRPGRARRDSKTLRNLGRRAQVSRSP